MDLKDIVLLIAGAILGIISQNVWTEIVKKYWEIKKLVRKHFFSGESLYNWLLEYYNKWGTGKELYRCKFKQYDILLPFLTKVDWLVDEPLDILAKNQTLCFEEAKQPFHNVNNKLIQKRKNMGQRIFNAATLYLDYIEEKENKEIKKLHVKTCDFYTAFSGLAKTEEETYKAILFKKTKNLKIRDTFYKSPDAAKMCGMKPNIACACTTIFQTENRTEVLLTKRSNEVITFGGAMAVVPAFGLVPIRHGDGDVKFTNLLFFNFLKEYLEELFSYDELIEEIRNKKGDPFWFYKLEEAKEFIQCYKNKGIELKVTGFGFDASNGGAFISMMLVLREKSYIKKIKETINLNWETGTENVNENTYEIVDVNSPQIGRWLLNCGYHYGSAFSLFRALDCLNKENF